MVIEGFAHKVVESKVLDIYIATGFFAMLIFFVLNSNAFTPMEIIIGTIMVTVVFKGISNIMFSLIILLFGLKNNKDSYGFRQAEEKLDLLVNEMKMKAAISDTKEKNGK